MASKFTWFSQHGAKWAAIALLSLPTVLPQFIDTRAVSENRALAVIPDLPKSWTEFLAMPGKTDAWIKDHFGFRTEMVEANNLLRFTLFGEFPSIRVTAGRHKRLFVTAHAVEAPPYSAVLDICDINQTTLKEFGAYLNELFGGFESMGLSPKLMIVPSAPTIQSADLPTWLGQRCGGNETPMTALLRSEYLAPNVKSAIYYPLDQMRARNKDVDLFPRSWFHWNGPGLEHIAQHSMNNMFPSVQSSAPRLLTHTTEQESDIQQMFPGIEVKTKITEPDLAASHIRACYGDKCYPEFNGFNDRISDTSRYHNPAAPDRRLLILSDSFGRFIAPWYARHYRDIEHVAVNNVRSIKDEQVRTLKEFVLRDPARTDILFLFHDGALSGTLRLGLQRLHRHGRDGMEEMHSPDDYRVLAQQIYVAYLGRPADVGGMMSLQRQLAEIGAPLELSQLNFAYMNHSGVRQLIDSFGKSEESRAIYSGNDSAFISAIYLHMFNRTPDAAGLHYWAEQLKNGKLTRSQALLAIASASQAQQSRQGLQDGALLRKKVAYSGEFTSSLVSARQQCYAGAGAAKKARSLLAAVKLDTDVLRSRQDAARMRDAACAQA